MPVPAVGNLSPPPNTTEEPLHPPVPSAAWSPFCLVLLIGSGSVFHLSSKQVDSSKNLLLQTGGGMLWAEGVQASRCSGPFLLTSSPPRAMCPECHGRGRRWDQGSQAGLLCSRARGVELGGKGKGIPLLSSPGHLGRPGAQREHCTRSIAQCRETSSSPECYTSLLCDLWEVFLTFLSPACLNCKVRITVLICGSV